MNEINPELELIERATSTARGPAAEASSDEAALYEGWSALAHVVTAADAADTFDETAFLEKLTRTIERDQAERHGGRSLHVEVGSRDESRRTWFLLLSALAATVVVCISAGIYFASQKWAGETVNEDNSKPTELVKSDVPPDAGDESLGWDDALDDQIQYVNHSLYQLESGDSINDRSLRTFGSQLEEFGKEMEVDSL